VNSAGAARRPAEAGDDNGTATGPGDACRWRLLWRGDTDGPQSYTPTWSSVDQHPPAQLFVDAGARFAGPVAEHHDGYSMWNSTVNEWNSVGTGPLLDLVGSHANAIRAKGLKFMVSLHHMGAPPAALAQLAAGPSPRL
jgi:hypothetical protein